MQMDRGQVMDVGLGSAAQSLVMMDTVLLSATYSLLAQGHVGHLTWAVLGCSARHSAEARHSIPRF